MASDEYMLLTIIVERQACLSKVEGSCDASVFSPWTNKHGKKIAAKQICGFMDDDEMFGKTRMYMFDHDGRLTTGFANFPLSISRYRLA